MKVCLVTGATGFIGQHMLAELAAAGRKMLALGKPEEVFCTAVLRDAGIRTAAAFPVSAAAFAKSDVQFCFGDVADGKFIESVFAAAEKGGMDIEFVLHLLPAPRFRKRRKTEGKPGGRIMTGQGMSLQRRCGAGSGTTVRSGDFLRFYGQGLRRRQPQFVP